MVLVLEKGDDHFERPEPEFLPCPPSWYLHKGHKMEVTHLHPIYNFLMIDGGLARVVITTPNLSRLYNGSLLQNDLDWDIEWFVNHGGDGFAEGTIFMSSDELRAAFGLIDDYKEVDKDSYHLRRQDKAPFIFAQGKFYRVGKYLNLPSRNSTGQGDPSVSIFLTDETKKCIRALLGDPPV